MSTARMRSGVRPRRWTKEEYYRLGELGFFDGQRVELIEGRLMVHSPQKSLHAVVVDAVDDVLGRLFGTNYLARCQLPLDLGQVLEPEPDVAIVLGTRWQYQHAHPTSAVLIVEVADATRSYDRRRKGSLYARRGSPITGSSTSWMDSWRSTAIPNPTRPRCTGTVTPLARTCSHPPRSTRWRCRRRRLRLPTCCRLDGLGTALACSDIPARG